MDTTLETKLLGLAERGERLLDALEARHGAPAPTDWSAPALRWHAETGLVGVAAPQRVALEQLVAIDAQKQTLLRNTRQFLAGAPANHALLWGARGTGKSSLVKALFNHFADDGLKLVEVDAADLVALPRIVGPLAGRDTRFLLFVDDLSFEGDDARYKALKAALDGSIEAPPDNVLIYATSNRRHLLPESLADNREARNVDGEIHHGDAVEEKISLSERFGLWLSFYPFNQTAYLDIVRTHLQALGVSPSDASDHAALQWALARGARSGRSARQFARDWAGQQILARRD